MLYEQGSHEIRGAFFTDSNELDPAVVTERSKFGLKKVFFVVWAILIMFSQNLSLFWPGLEIGFVQFPSQNPCEKLETSLSARHVWESCLCRKRNHLDGRWELSKMFSSFFFGNFCRSHYCKNLCQIGEVGDFIHSDRYNEMKNRCSILFFCWEIEKMYPVLEKNCFVCARAWSSSAHATQTMRRCWLCWGFSLRYSGFVIYCQIKIQNTNM